MKIAILGTGGVAHALGAGWKKSGHDVIFGARDASATDPDFEITGLQDALAAGDVIGNAIPRGDEQVRPARRTLDLPRSPWLKDAFLTAPSP